MRKVLGLMIVATLSLPAVASTHHRKSSTSASISHRSSSSHKASPQAIAPERATAIQSALIKQGYLSGEPSGTWDAASIAAMQKLQSDNGWQTKYTPDARALNKLGLGSTGTAVAAAPIPLQ